MLSIIRLTNLDWLIHTDAGLFTRIGVGAAIFMALAATDLYRNGSRATRWREYLFLLAVVAAAMVYGAINDQITSRISWEYFFYGKGLASTLGPATPPNQAVLCREAMKIGLKATWSAGLIIGAAILIANNPSRSRPQLPYRRLFKHVAMVLAFCLACAMALGVAGHRGWLVGLSSNFADMHPTSEFRPQAFMTVFGIHLGGYVGGAIGTAVACVSIRRARKREMLRTRM
ncbi:MAG TPA: hypothetical protein VFE47_21910 [Tepidisphaeraceae bacterium]|jgi:hypothetical protein|nr:hypothetical protein [Tepidisphaeraceae bacterium]